MFCSFDSTYPDISVSGCTFIVAKPHKTRNKTRRAETMVPLRGAQGMRMMALKGHWTYIYFTWILTSIFKELALNRKYSRNICDLWPNANIYVNIHDICQNRKYSRKYSRFVPEIVKKNHHFWLNKTSFHLHFSLLRHFVNTLGAIYYFVRENLTWVITAL